MPEVPTKTLGIVEAVLAQIDGTAKDITEPNLNELTVEKLKSILKTSGSFVSGNKPVLVARIFAEVEATKWKQESFLKYPEWLPDLVIPMSFKARSALLKSVNNTTYTVLTEEYAMCLPQFTQDQLNFILMTPSTSALFPYSKSLIRCELFQEQDITLKFRHHKNNYCLEQSKTII